MANAIRNIIRRGASLAMGRSWAEDDIEKAKKALEAWEEK